MSLQTAAILAFVAGIPAGYILNHVVDWLRRIGWAERLDRFATAASFGLVCAVVLYWLQR